MVCLLLLAVLIVINIKKSFPNLKKVYKDQLTSYTYTYKKKLRGWKKGNKKVDINILFFKYLHTMHSITLRCTINIANWFCDINCTA